MTWYLTLDSLHMRRLHTHDTVLGGNAIITMEYRVTVANAVQQTTTSHLSITHFQKKTTVAGTRSFKPCHHQKHKHQTPNNPSDLTNSAKFGSAIARPHTLHQSTPINQHGYSKSWILRTDNAAGNTPYSVHIEILISKTCTRLRAFFPDKDNVRRLCINNDNHSLCRHNAYTADRIATWLAATDTSTNSPTRTTRDGGSISFPSTFKVVVADRTKIYTPGPSFLVSLST